jgi:hypothetical protein
VSAAEGGQTARNKRAFLSSDFTRRTPDAVTPKESSRAAIKDKTLEGNLVPFSYPMFRLSVTAA